ncbi:MAG TPA: DUF3224 domain-containing protein [Povalibacter sp.]|nr:DUF3224 domain-containing protein [Povalibacter sp.]
MSHHAKGTFDVKMLPQQDAGGDAALGRFLLDKTFHGDLEGTSRGQMLTAGTAVEGSAGYVAFERVTGTLLGRRGSFVLQHIGTMRAGQYYMSVKVLPDSGTDELSGLSGTMTIVIEGGGHSYLFDYSFE